MVTSAEVQIYNLPGIIQRVDVSRFTGFLELTPNLFESDVNVTRKTWPFLFFGTGGLFETGIKIE